MNAEQRRIMMTLVDMLNSASEKYYNGIESGMTDTEWDEKFERLKRLEDETGFSLANSPSKNVGSNILNNIKKVTIDIPMLSLDKCHSEEEVIKFANGKRLIASVKLDGLSLRLIYKDGNFTSANTRGNGVEGSDVTEHVKCFKNVPMIIDKKGTYIIDGEAIITLDDFDKINSKLPESEKYANPRNLAAGTLNLLDMNIVTNRHLKFIAWDVIKGNEINSLFVGLHDAEALGFTVVPHYDNFYKSFVNSNGTNAFTKEHIKLLIDEVKKLADIHGYPMDGIVFKFDNVEYGKSLGRTSRSFNNGIAYKFSDTTVNTILRDIEWSAAKTCLTPVAIFDPVELEGTTVTRASLHNVSICKDLELGIGDEITVYKANMIIPQVKDNLTRSGFVGIPRFCPICGAKTDIIRENETEVLICTSEDCSGKLLGKLSHFCSKEAINIDGMSEATVKFLVEKGWISNFSDIFRLNQYKNDWMSCEGFGEKSVKKLLSNIEKARNTTLSRFIYSLSIPLIGKTASKSIEKFIYDNIAKQNRECNSFTCFMFHLDNKYDWTQLDDFGNKMATSLDNYFSAHMDEIKELAEYFIFEKPKSISAKSISVNDKIADKTFVITGSLNLFKNRNELVAKIEELGGKVSGSVSTKTDYLINNDVTSNSSKNKKAKDLNIPIISEQDFVNLFQ